jgi:hypothetical protein
MIVTATLLDGPQEVRRAGGEEIDPADSKQHGYLLVSCPPDLL